MALLETEGLCVDFGRVPVVRDVGLRVASGQGLAVIGESGAGKSMTARSIVGLTPPSVEVRGSIRFDGRELVGAPEAVLRAVRGRGIGFVWQEAGAALDPTMTVGNQVAEGAPGSGRVHALHWLRRVGLQDAERVARCYPHQLSGGMRRRAVLAAALAARPRLLIADELTAGLDPPGAAGISEILAQLRSEDRMALLVITHDLALAARVADRVAVMYAGQVVEEGPAAVVLRRPAHPYTRGLLAALPAGGLHPIPGAPPDPAAPPSVCAFAPRCPVTMRGCFRESPLLLPADAPEHHARCWLLHPEASRRA